MDNPSLMGFGTFKVDNSEKVGSIFSASQVSAAVDNDDNDEGFVTLQGVLFFAACESDNNLLILRVFTNQANFLQHFFRCHQRHLPKVPGANTLWTAAI